MPTTIQISQRTKQLLATLKKRSKARSYDHVLRQLLIEHLKVPHSLAGKFPRLRWNKEDRTLVGAMKQNPSRSKKPRTRAYRRFTKEYKQKILAEIDAAPSDAKKEILKREGLKHYNISDWREEPWLAEPQEMLAGRNTKKKTRTL